MFDHVGLLVNEPPAQPSCSPSSHPTNLRPAIEPRLVTLVHDRPWVRKRNGGLAPPCRDYFFLDSRKLGRLTSVKTTTSSPLTVLMSWCRLITLTPVTSSTIASMRGRAVSIRWVRTCLSRSRPFSAGKRLDEMLLGGRQNTAQADQHEITEQITVNVLGTATHVILLKATHAFANGRFNFTLRLHGSLERSVKWPSRRRPRSAAPGRNRRV